MEQALKEEEKRRPLTRTESDAYLAGIMDGEGCIYFNKKSRTYYLTVGNTDAPLIEWIKDNYGGYYEVIKDKRPTRKIFYRLTWASKDDLVRMFGLLIPFLLVKRTLAKTALEYVVKYKLTMREYQKYGALAGGKPSVETNG